MEGGSPSAAAIPTAGSAADILSLSPTHPHLLSEIPFHRPSLPAIPFVSKTICLLPFYRLLLSDSEALALPKFRTFIYAMKPTKRKRVSLTVEQKFQIVSIIEVGETLKKLSKEVGVGVSTAGDMRRDSEKNQKNLCNVRWKIS
ncbi:hypothetical protein AVEN_15274-1 [Araneus ventricosus]|uniref:HTH psq-type domain-containing protein n=1 Tax=Araneus ventricosus TaxID=182803 RepID=A0A4Y2K751_ARAVE|nr:hypothetical protein AVEN_15274-1 [Araneus ventricosus]